MKLRSLGATRVLRSLAVAAVASIALSSCSLLGPDPVALTAPSPMPNDPAARADLQRFYDQKLSWTACTSGYECADLLVPVEYDKPEATTKIALIRLPTTSRGKDRLGSLVVNFGGPGVSGVQYLPVTKGAVAPSVKKAFDIVSFDPRGVGSSSPVRCLTDAQTDAYFDSDSTPDNDQERAESEKSMQQLVQGCAADPLASHIGTRDVARDLDVLRAALGDAKLSYLGYSYGTYLGSLYAEQFPQRVGRFVLDGAVDPTQDPVELVTSQAKGFEEALRAYLTDCLDQEDCPFTGSVDEAVQQIASMMSALDDRPMRTGTRPLSQTMAFYGLITPLYSQQSWPALTQALTAALKGDGSGLLSLADTMLGRGLDGTYRDNSATVIIPINCLDRAPSSVDEKKVQQALHDYPVFGPFLLEGIDQDESQSCGGLPTASTEQGPIHARGADPILVVAATGDPATPYAGSKALAQQLDSGVLLTRKGEGHTSYGGGNSCIDAAVNSYLISSELPGKNC